MNPLFHDFHSSVHSHYRLRPSGIWGVAAKSKLCKDLCTLPLLLKPNKEESEGLWNPSFPKRRRVDGFCLQSCTLVRWTMVFASTGGRHSPGWVVMFGSVWQISQTLHTSSILAILQNTTPPTCLSLAASHKGGLPTCHFPAAGAVVGSCSSWRLSFPSGGLCTPPSPRHC